MGCYGNEPRWFLVSSRPSLFNHLFSLLFLKIFFLFFLAKFKLRAARMILGNPFLITTSNSMHITTYKSKGSQRQGYYYKRGAKLIFPFFHSVKSKLRTVEITLSGPDVLTTSENTHSTAYKSSRLQRQACLELTTKK